MKYDVIVIGGGQSGLAMGYYLRRSGLSYIILDSQKESGGAWLHTWQSLRLFSPAQWSSLPGMIMTTDRSGQAGGSDYYPTRDGAIEYLKFYETKYNLPVKRKVEVFNVQKVDEEFQLQTSAGLLIAKAVVSATGSFNNPIIPEIKGVGNFNGRILHSSQYESPSQFENKRVAVVGEGNSGAQILAEVSEIAGTIWITKNEPRFLPDHIDGRFLFDAATQMYEAQKAGKQYKPPSLGDIVMVDSVKDARSRKVLKSLRPFDHFTDDAIVWGDGHEEKIDVVIFCTGFKPALTHLKGLDVVNEDGKADTNGTRSKKVNGLWLVGYGNWTGFASATLIGVGRSAKATVEEVVKYLSTSKKP
jgi:cation diffusion facilitator CzcD-associated flavoprotein CzcO